MCALWSVSPAASTWRESVCVQIVTVDKLLCHVRRWRFVQLPAQRDTWPCASCSRYSASDAPTAPCRSRLFRHGVAQPAWPFLHGGDVPFPDPGIASGVSFGAAVACNQRASRIGVGLVCKIRYRYPGRVTFIRRIQPAIIGSDRRSCFNAVASCRRVNTDVTVHRPRRRRRRFQSPKSGLRRHHNWHRRVLAAGLRRKPAHRSDQHSAALAANNIAELRLAIGSVRDFRRRPSRTRK